LMEQPDTTCEPATMHVECKPSLKRFKKM
jgi:hypothetical protein